MNKFLLLFLLFSITSCKSTINKQLIADLKTLSSDAFEGRRPGTAGSAKARDYIISRIKDIGTEPFKSSYTDSFELKFIPGEFPGVNIHAMKKGTTEKNKMIVISAHYDHLGIKNNEIYNGANDNATGVSVLLNLMAEFKDYSSKHSFLYLFFDAEEFSKQGVKHFLETNEEEYQKIALNFNIDMLDCRSSSELYVCGTYQFPHLKEILDPSVQSFSINYGHDGTTKNEESWVQSSDHGNFYQLGIPFIYFGSENEDFYNTPQDDFKNIDQECFNSTFEMAKKMIIELDQQI